MLVSQTDYEDDFIKSNPLLPDYIRRLQHWRDRYEKYLDSRPRVQPLDLLSHWLTEFQYAKFDEVEVPGQYLEVRTECIHCIEITNFFECIARGQQRSVQSN